jgi:hypothetical protein
MSALWPDLALSVAVSWYFSLALTLPSGRRSPGRQSRLTGVRAVRVAGWCPDRLFPLGSCAPDERHGDSPSTSRGGMNASFGACSGRLSLEVSVNGSPSPWRARRTPIRYVSSGSLASRMAGAEYLFGRLFGDRWIMSPASWRRPLAVWRHRWSACCRPRSIPAWTE